MRLYYTWSVDFFKKRILIYGNSDKVKSIDFPKNKTQKDWLEKISKSFRKRGNRVVLKGAGYIVVGSYCD